MRTGIIILAAGNASRMGQPKQLLQYRGRSFIRRISQEASKVVIEVVVVLGAYSDIIAPEMADLHVHTVINKEWARGMAGSVTTGLRALGNVEQVIIAVADQPFVTAALFSEMIAQQAASGKGIVACAYSGVTGTPVLFDQRYFPELLALTGEEGAKRILRAHAADVVTVDFAAGAIDIDTEEDFDRLPG
jgi:molybdenum cofactor cytidylyltransferase